MPEQPQPDAARDLIGKVLGHTPSGVFILTAGDGNGRTTGMLASWVQQAAFDPPMVSVAVNRQRYLHDWLDRAPRLVLNIVAEGQGHLLKHFARGFEPDKPAFDGIQTRDGALGLPILADTFGYLEGEIAGRMEAGDHIVYLLRVDAAGTGARFDHRPMVHIRKNAFRY